MSTDKKTNKKASKNNKIETVKTTTKNNNRGEARTDEEPMVAPFSAVEGLE